MSEPQPHGYCLLWNSELLWLHVVGDLVIMLAYVLIPATLLYLLWRVPKLPYRWMVGCFTTFVFLCGMTHLMELITVWYPIYWVAGMVKILAAVMSMVTAILLGPVVGLVEGYLTTSTQHGGSEVLP